MPDLAGRTAVVTGANSGLGLETARQLAAHGAHVVLACRDGKRGTDALADIARSTPGAALELASLDLAELASVRDFADAYNAAHDGLDILINNAGVMAIPARVTLDGFEMQFATNHLGHFALTGRLLPSLLVKPAARVVTLSSLVALIGSIHFDDLQSWHRYQPWMAYAQSKLANQIFAFELDRRARASGVGLISVAVHPGYASTNLQTTGPRMAGRRLQTGFMQVGNAIAGQSSGQGALPALYGATMPGVTGGEYFGPGGPLGLRGHPQRVRPTRAGRDIVTARRLWEVSVELTGVGYDGLATAA